MKSTFFKVINVLLIGNFITPPFQKICEHCHAMNIIISLIGEMHCNAYNLKSKV